MSDQTLNYNIKTSAELAGMKEYIESLENSIKVAKASGLSTEALEHALKDANKEYGSSAIASHTAALQAQRVQLVAAGKDVANLDKQLAALNQTQPLSRWGKIKEGLGDIAGDLPIIGAFKNVLNGSTLMAGGVAAAGTAIVEGLKKAEEEFSATEDKVAALDAALANNGQLTDDYREHLQKLAGQLEETTNIADTEWLGVLTRLTQFGANSSNIDGYAQTVKNLAGIMGGDVVGAANLFSRAMQGDTAELSRLGIQVDSNLTLTQKLAEIQRQAAARGAGQLEASTNTLTGSMKGLNLAVDEVFKGLGNLVNGGGGRSETVDFFTAMLREVRSLLPDTVKQVEGMENRFKGAGDLSAAAAANVADIGTAAQKSLAQVDQLNAGFTRSVQLISLRQQLEDKLIDAETAAKLSDLDNGIGQYAGMSDSQKLQAGHDIRHQGDKRKEANAWAADDDKITTLTAAQKHLDDIALAAEHSESGYIKEVADLDKKIAANAVTGKLKTVIADNATERYNKAASHRMSLDDPDMTDEERKEITAPAFWGEDAPKKILAQRKVEMEAAAADEKKSLDENSQLVDQRGIADANRKASAEIAKSRRADAAKLRPETQHQIEDINIAGSNRDDITLVDYVATENAEGKKIAAARKQDAALNGIATHEAPVFQREAQTVGRAAKKSGNTELFEVAKTLNEAAGHMKDHPTMESLQALKDAAQNLKNAAEKSKTNAAQTALLSKQVATLIQQVTGLLAVKNSN